jgi:hypothetical protein
LIFYNDANFLCLAFIFYKRFRTLHEFNPGNVGDSCVPNRFGFAHVSAPRPAPTSPDQPRLAQLLDLARPAAALGLPTRQNQGLTFYKTGLIFNKPD